LKHRAAPNIWPERLSWQSMIQVSSPTSSLQFHRIRASFVSLFTATLRLPLLPYPRWFACPRLSRSPLLRTSLSAHLTALGRLSSSPKQSSFTPPLRPSPTVKLPCTSRNTLVDHVCETMQTTFISQVVHSLRSRGYLGRTHVLRIRGQKCR
jgi:hypothetical protein